MPASSTSARQPRCSRNAGSVSGSAYRRFGAGLPVGHLGGRRIWQFDDHAVLLVGWRVTNDADDARTETAMLADFRAHYGRLPFVNVRG